MEKINEKEIDKSLVFDSREYIAGNIKEYKVAVFGSRTLFDERVKVIILEEILKRNATKIITSQEPEGVCEVGQRVARDYGYPLQLHFLNFKYLRGAFEQRSKEIVKEADFFIIIHDGVSKGTHNELILVKKSGKPYRYEVLEKTQYARSVGFNIKKEWGKDENTKVEIDKSTIIDDEIFKTF